MSTAAPLTALDLVLALYGAGGGALGVLAAFYLYRVRPDRGQPTTILALFAMGIGMWMVSSLLAAPPPDAWLSALVFVTHSLLLVAILALTVVDARPKLWQDIRTWAFKPPYFVHPEHVRGRDNDESHAD